MFKLEEGWITVALLAAMMTAASWGVAAASWAEGLWAGWFTGLTGIVAGLVLSKSRFSGPRASVFALIYGLFAVGFFISANLDGDWHQRSLEFVVRMNNFLYKLIYGGTSRDPLPFPVFVATVFWLVGVSGAWAVFRRGSVWPAIIPGGLALTINVYYYLGPVQLDLYLAVYVLLALILVARMSLFAREREWQAARVAYNPELRFDFLRAGLAVALAAVLIGWAGPGLAASPAAINVWQRVTGPWQHVREGWVRMFASVRAHGQNVNDFFGSSLTLGGPTLLDDSPIMDVTLGPFDEVIPGVQINTPVARFYWRAVSYEDYDNGRWTSDDSEPREFDPELASFVRQPIYQLRRDVNLSIVSYVVASSRLYTAPQPKWVDRPSTFEVLTTPGGAADVASVRSRNIVRGGETYRLIASVSVADQESLRAAGRNYPQWVVDNYLDLPNSITPRTAALARQIVEDAGAENPYDQAEAITEWLRANITYDQLIEGAPADAEPVDWLLFTARKGYCNYYATAEVVLLRSLGIPARLTVGMSEGAFDPVTVTYHVQEKNAHAWPEVFFPNYGWVEFEPTASEPPLVRPERSLPFSDSETVQSDADGTGDPADTEGRERPFEDEEGAIDPTAVFIRVWLDRLRAIGLTTLAMLGVAAVVIGVGTATLLRLGMIGWENLGEAGRRVLRWRKLPIPSIIAMAYLNLERAARWLGLSLASALTPYERAEALNRAVPEEARQGVDTITEQYVAEKYSPQPAQAKPLAARAAWARIRFPVVRQALLEWARGLRESGWRKAERAPGARELDKN